MIRKIAGWGLLALACYVLLGALVPYVQHKSVETELPQPQTATDERVMWVQTNEDALTWRLRLIESAQDELVLSTFDFMADDAGGDILAALGAAADRGVRVRVLVDGFNGQMHFQGKPMVRALAAKDNAELRLYNPINILKPWSINPRLHDKYLVADGKIYILGGRNVSDRFLGTLTESSSLDRDLLVRREDAGGTAADILAYFEEIWSLPQCRTVKGEANDELLATRYAQLREKHPQAFEPVDWRDCTMETNGVKLLCGSPKAENKPPLVWKQLCREIERGQEILIQTPYVICSGEMYDDLTALCEGRRVEIATNAVENGANVFGCADFLNNRDKILETGAHIRTLSGGHSMHTKSIFIDDTVSIVGSFNLDMRSAYLDTEMMLVVDCPELNRELREDVAREPYRLYAPDGTVDVSPDCPDEGLPFGKSLLYGVLRALTPAVRFLL